MASDPPSKTHQEMAALSHQGMSDAEIAEHVNMSARELGAEWSLLQESVEAATRSQAVEIVIAQMIQVAGTALKSEKNKLALVLASREGKAVLTFDLNGIITGLSPFAEKLLGMPRERMIGRGIDSLLNARGEGVSQSSEEMERAETGEHVETVRTHRRSDGSTFDAEHCVVAIVGPMGEVTGFVRDIEDVTQRRIHEVRIAELNTSIALLVQK